MERRRDQLELLVLYQNPTDFPGKLVVRRQVVRSGEVLPDAEPMLVLDDTERNLLELRQCFGARIWLRRSDRDEEQIVGVWL